MSLTAADVAEIMRLVEQSGFDELTLEIDGIKLSLRRGAAAELSSEPRLHISADDSAETSATAAAPAAAEAETHSQN